MIAEKGCEVETVSYQEQKIIAPIQIFFLNIPSFKSKFLVFMLQLADAE